MTDTIESIGRSLDGPQERDAIHVAVAAVKAERRLFPGQRVDAAGNPHGTYVGVVDPFADDVIVAGEWFWLFLKPGTVSGMRHHWQHPSFPDSTPEAQGKKVELARQSIDRRASAINRIGEIADSLGLSAHALMEAADEYQDTLESTVQQGSEHWRDTFYDVAKEFWVLYAVVTGKVPKEPEANIFCCTC